MNKRNICVGVLAHVDAGKTTLSEAVLYNSGKLRKLGRVDKKDAFLDNYSLERERGITIFSKQATFEYGDCSFTLLDTPGHVDFSPEMERALSVLDVCILTISGPDGIQAHTRTLWKLLKTYDIPTFIFVNKMDRDICDKQALINELKSQLSDGCVDFTGADEVFDVETLENISLLDEDALNEFLETGNIDTSCIRDLVGMRKLFPCFFGSALKNDGVIPLLEGIVNYLPEIENTEEFGARIFKIGRDNDGKRLTYMKVTGGCLTVREQMTYYPDFEGNTEDDGDDTSLSKASGSSSASINDGLTNDAGRVSITEKINEIRIYDGAKYTTVDKAVQGMVVAVTGLSQTRPGISLGNEELAPEARLTPVLEYKVVENDKSKLRAMIPKFRQLEEEEPQLHVLWNQELKELQIRVMGQVQLEILKSRFKELFDEDVIFDRGSILYKETVTAPVLGVGHYEPLRHYAEVQLMLEPNRSGASIEFRSICNVNELEKNWQRLICTHVYERRHAGVMIGAPVTDCVYTLVAGRAHQKHTEGGDFRQATYRAIRHALMRARQEGKTRILEPYYELTLELPRANIGRAMTDIEMKSGKITGQHELSSNAGNDMVLLTAVAPVSTVQDYPATVTDYTGGLGSVYCTFSGYGPCHNEDQVILSRLYDPDADMRNPSYSVFCAHGAGFSVPWNEVENYKHIDCEIQYDYAGNSWSVNGKRIVGEKDTDELIADLNRQNESVDSRAKSKELFVSTEEIDSILAGTSFANRKNEIKNPYRKHKQDVYDKYLRASKSGSDSSGNSKNTGSIYSNQKEKYLLVDGYNIIFTWKELNELAKDNIDSARDKLNDILMNYQAMKKCKLIVVYDAYRVSGHPTEYYTINNITVVYTKEAETADKFIERFAHDNAKLYDITVATSDGLEQIIIRGQGAALLTANDLLDEIKYYKRNEESAMPVITEKATTSLGSVLNKLDNEDTNK